MTRDALLQRLTAQAEADERVLALLLGGSLGRGDGDAWSDIDLVAVVAPEDHPGFVEGARAWVEQAAPLVVWRPPWPNLPLFNAITETWERVDLTVTVPGRVLGARSGYRPLVDRAGVWGALPPSRPEGKPDPARVAALVQEFIRVLGLLPVGLGRREYAVAVTGWGMQRTALISLLIEELGLPSPPGALHLSKLLAAEDMRMLEALPAPAAERASLLAANHAVAAAFVPRARALVMRVDAAWPEVFWAATQAHLARELGDEWPSLEN